MTSKRKPDWCKRAVERLRKHAVQEQRAPTPGEVLHVVQAAYRRGQRDERATVTEIAQKGVQLACLMQRTAIAAELRALEAKYKGRDNPDFDCVRAEAFGDAAAIVENWGTK